MPLPDWLGDTLGGLLLIAGQAMRTWAVKHAGKTTRSRSLKANVLTTTGPYAVVRNPIYGGNFMLGLGFLMLTEALVLVPVFLVAFSTVYGLIIRAEEEFLAVRFGAAYETYRRAVPRFLPLSVMALRAAVGHAGAALPVKEYGTIAGTLIGAVLFELAQHLNVHELLMRAIGWSC